MGLVLFYSESFCLAAPTAPDKTDASKKSTGLEAFDVQKDFDKLPTSVSSNALTLKAKEKIFEYTGNVEVIHGDLTLKADTLEGTYDDKSQIQKMTAKSNVLITKGPAIKATSQKAIYDKKSDTLTLTENPQLEQNGNILSADLIRLFIKEERSVAEGTVRVKVANSDAINTTAGK